MKAARIVNVNEPLQIQELQPPKPKGSQILIKVQSSGVCHSDVHVWEVILVIVFIVSHSHNLRQSQLYSRMHGE
jgi:Zn-dependent alcohol dehydrogenase